jgi:hypothetical protein
MVVGADDHSESSFSVGKLETKPLTVFSSNNSLPSLAASSVSNQNGRRVKFAAENDWTVHTIENVDEELHGILWYGREEFDYIALRDKLVLESFDAGIFQESKEHTMRGLENHLEDLFVAERRERAMYAVFEEQYRRRQTGHRFLDKLPATYLLRSKYALKLALAAAKQDADEVKARQKRQAARMEKKKKRREERRLQKERKENFPNLRLEV